MLLYYITDRKSLEGTDAQQRKQLLVKIGEAAQAGVDYIQLREKDLAARELERLARDAVRIVRDHSATAKLLVNGRADIALAREQTACIFPRGELDASEVRALWMQGDDRAPIIAVSAHTIAEVRAIEPGGQILRSWRRYSRRRTPMCDGIGLDALRAACAGSTSLDNSENVLSSFGVRGESLLANARACLAAGAAGVAGIRLFQNGDIVETVRHLREWKHHNQNKLTTDRPG